MTEASTLDAPAPPGPQPKRRIDPARGRRVQPRGPGPPELALRFTDRERGDLPTVRLQPGQVTLLEGRAGVEAIRQRLVVDCAARGRSVMHVVGGNRLDSTSLARRAQARGLDPGYVLRASVVARGFTAYQLSVLVEERLPAHLADHNDVALAVVSDPLALYTHEDVRCTEGRTLAEQALASLSRTAEDHTCPVLLVQPPRGQRGGRPSPRAPHQRPVRQDPELDQLIREHADEHLRLSVQGAARVLELLDRDERYRIADPRPRQARLERFGDGDGADAHQPEPGSSRPVAACAEVSAGG